MQHGPLYRLHRFLAARSFYALALCSLLALGVLAGRIVLSDTFGFRFLVWNLFLAWVPYLLSLLTEALHRPAAPRRLAAALTGCGWLLFFPNAPYLVTDFVHLPGARGVPWWYDVGLLAIFAWTGCFLGVVSLWRMQRVVRRSAGAAAAWVFVLLAAGLGGLGVYLGRFGRWNSWDLLLAPAHVLADLHAVLGDTRALREALGVTGLFAALLIACFATFVSVRPRLTAEEA